MPLERNEIVETGSDPRAEPIFNGGFGKITGVTLAILILQFLSSGLNMFENVSNFYRDVIWGGDLILVLVFNRLLSQRAERRALKR
jgi:simple sugar transport system permease protein